MKEKDQFDLSIGITLSRRERRRSRIITLKLTPAEFLQLEEAVPKGQRGQYIRERLFAQEVGE
ncbi:hypothetical protein J4211_03035 [Candidatus Woesearchaeota archaeon]|nr:hypothetical protein [Candidatus Woesearchaeota archaeon]